MLAEVEAAIVQADAALDAVISGTNWWLDVPFAFTDDDMEAMENQPTPLRIEVTCGFCASKFWPLDVAEEHGGFYCHSFWNLCYYQPGYWFGDPGNGRHFPVCSDGCHDGLQRVLGKRMVHAAAEMATIAHARRLIKECRVTARRLRNAQKPRGRTAIGAGSHSRNQVLGRLDRVPECVAG